MILVTSNEAKQLATAAVTVTVSTECFKQTQELLLSVSSTSYNGHTGTTQLSRDWKAENGKSRITSQGKCSYFVGPKPANRLVVGAEWP